MAADLLSSVNREAERTLTYVSIRDNGADKVVAE